MKVKNKKIKLAKHAGFCYGVQRAVEQSIKIKKENDKKPVYILGQLIHNNQVIEYLSNLGIQTIENIPEKLEGICIIRTHGVAPQVIKALEDKGCEVVDSTCPDVKRVQNKAKDLAKEGYRVVIIGKADHPEVIAIKAHSDLCSSSEAILISSKEEALKKTDEIKKSGKIGIVVQTTQYIENYKQIIPIIAEHARELKIHNTICSATCKRQQAACELADEADLMIVVGSRSSANTTHLAEILKPLKETLHIESKEELAQYKDLIAGSKIIGVTAGASTPEFLIDEVIKEIGELNT